MSDYVELRAAAAACFVNGVAMRGAAHRIWVGQANAPAALRQRSASLATELSFPPGRVVAGGVFTEPVAHISLRAALPADLRGALKESFEWYGCRGAFFHTDAHYGEVVFGAWCVAGSPRDIVFARAGVRARTSVGTVVVFDPFEPHAVLEPGDAAYERARYEDAAISMFVGFELQLDTAVRAALGIGAPVAAALALSSKTAVNAETGAIAG
jgi:hypothetical protein